MILKYVLGLFTFTYLEHSFGLYIGGMTFLLIVPCVIIGTWLNTVKAERKYLENTPEDVIIVSTLPGGETPYLGDLQKHVIVVPYSRVKSKVDWVEKVVQNNEWFCKETHGNNRAKIYGLIYQHGEHVTEDFEAYKERLVVFVKDSLKARHTYIAKKAPIWYAWFLDHQRDDSFIVRQLRRLIA